MAANPDKKLRSRQRASTATARVVPVIVTLIVAYISYVVVGPLGVDYLLRDQNPQTGTAAAIIAVWFILLIPFLISWVRLLSVVIINPGYIDRHPLSINEGDRIKTPGLESFYNRDVFVCDLYGLPILCRYCNNWKPDRAHHNQDVDRCTLKMDHFCPWVGGVVGEQSYKFFVQFLVYALLQSTYGMVLLAYYVSQDRNKVQWIIALALAAFFVFFTLGMVVNSLWMVFRNVTSIENIDIKPRGRPIHVAVHLPPEVIAADLSIISSNGNHVPQKQEAGHDGGVPYSKSPPWKTTITYPLALPADRPPLPAPIPRTFAVLELPLGLNPWDLGSGWENFKEVFGEKPYDWFLPLHYSPCCDSSSSTSRYSLGPGFRRHLTRIGFPNPSFKYDSFSNATTNLSTPSRARRKRVLDDGWRNGERPNGWWTQKEARRLRHQGRVHNEDKS